MSTCYQLDDLETLGSQLIMAKNLGMDIDMTYTKPHIVKFSMKAWVTETRDQ